LLAVTADWLVVLVDFARFFNLSGLSGVGGVVSVDRLFRVGSVASTEMSVDCLLLALALACFIWKLSRQS
jgi:hypothetical protein